jgi:pantoate--beta-alanine ligase
MKIIVSIKDLKQEIKKARSKKQSIGFIPTMGALHQGHLSLAKTAKKENDVVIMSIFVNPMQFGPKEDFKKYPRTLKQDAKLATGAGVDIIFAPDAKEMYSDDFYTFLDMKGLTDRFCGKSRPGHFKGVLTVVAKLFNIVEPDTAYFGQKDYQQATIIQRMVKDLNMNLRVMVLPTVREEDGLAMSSRNRYLTSSQRKYAYRIYQALVEARAMIQSGENDCAKIIKKMEAIIKTIPESRIDYIAIADSETLEILKKTNNHNVVILAAVFVGKTRLIDNILIRYP